MDINETHDFPMLPKLRGFSQRYTEPQPELGQRSCKAVRACVHSPPGGPKQWLHAKCHLFFFNIICLYSPNWLLPLRIKQKIIVCARTVTVRLAHTYVQNVGADSASTCPPPVLTQPRLVRMCALPKMSASLQHNQSLRNIRTKMKAQYTKRHLRGWVSYCQCKLTSRAALQTLAGQQTSSNRSRTVPLAYRRLVSHLC